MATKKQLEDAIKALEPILKQLSEFEKTYGPILKEYHQGGIMSEDDRNDAAIRMIKKYSNL